MGSEHTERPAERLEGGEDVPFTEFDFTDETGDHATLTPTLIAAPGGQNHSFDLKPPPELPEGTGWGERLEFPAENNPFQNIKEVTLNEGSDFPCASDQCIRSVRIRRSLTPPGSNTSTVISGAVTVAGAVPPEFGTFSGFLRNEPDVQNDVTAFRVQVWRGATRIAYVEWEPDAHEKVDESPGWVNASRISVVLLTPSGDLPLPDTSVPEGVPLVISSLGVDVLPIRTGHIIRSAAVFGPTTVA